MIPLNQLLKQLAQRLEKLPRDGAVEVLTYKRNRGFIVWKEGEDSFLIREHGYHVEIYDLVNQDGLEKLVRKIVKREFPRSTQIRIYTHQPGDVLLIQDNLSIRI